jgi:hypothetical protein
MERSRIACAVGTSALVALLAGCGGGTPPQVASPAQSALAVQSRIHPATNPQWVIDRLARAPVARAASGRSHMKPGAKKNGLLYVVDTGAATANVYSESTWGPFGDLLGFTRPYTACVDKAGDVYITDFSGDRVTEYAHGSITPMRTLSDHQGNPVSCAVDPKTGDLAISNFNGPSSTPGNVIVYRGAKGNPIRYSSSVLDNYFFVGYDDNDNLFLNGVGGSIVYLAELPKGKSAFKTLSVNQTFGFPGGIAWDGVFLAVADQEANIIYQLKVSGSKATVHGSTTLNGASDVFQFWLTGGSAKHPQATSVIGADYGASAVDKWQYPAGGTALKTLTGLSNPEGVAISN